MDQPDQSLAKGSRHRRRPSIEGLEGRQLLTTSSTALTSRVAQVRHEYHEFVSELRNLELRSQATPSQYLALRDDARAISEAASTTTLAPVVADAKAIAVSYQLDRATIDGWLGDPGWSETSARLAANLDGLNVPPPLIDRTIADMKAIASSAGVSSAEYQTLTADSDALRDGEATIRNSGYHFPDPGLYFSQHVRGFFRSLNALRVEDEAKLEADLHAIEARTGETPTGSAVLRRDARLLERIGAGLPSHAADQLDNAFAAAFARGTPGAQEQARLKVAFQALLGQGVLSASVDRLIADAPAFDRAAGSSPDNIRQIVDDVRVLVGVGGESTINPFKVQVVRNPGGPGASRAG